MTFRLLTVILIVLTTKFGQAQSKDDYERLSGLRYGYNFNRLHDFGLSYGRIRQRELSMIGAARSHGYFVGFGYGTNFSNSIFTTKISYDIVEFVFAGRLSLVNYTDFRGNQTFVLPEVGLTFSGLVSIMYGYRIDLTDNAFDVSRSSVSLTFTPFTLN